MSAFQIWMAMFTQPLHLEFFFFFFFLRHMSLTEHNNPAAQELDTTWLFFPKELKQPTCIGKNVYFTAQVLTHIPAWSLCF